jgi:hypothetical protein
LPANRTGVSKARITRPKRGTACRREGIAQSLYYSWSKEFLEADIPKVVAAFRLFETEGKRSDDRWRHDVDAD